MSSTPFDLAAGTEEFYFDADYYDYEFKSRKDDVNWYVQRYVKAAGPLLELGVGSGRIALPAVRKGAQVTGIDLSETMLEQAQKHRARLAKSKRSSLILHHDDMRSFELAQNFELVSIPFNAFMHLYSIDDVDRCLTQVRRHLVDGGQLLLDVLVPDLDYLTRSPFKKYEGITFTHPTFREKYRYSEQSAYNPLTQINQMWFFYDRIEKHGKGPESFCIQLSHRCFFPQEMRRILSQHGFVVEETHGDFTLGELRSDNESIAFVCRKVSREDVDV